VPLLLCDLDDTLIDRAGAFERWARNFAVRRGIDAEHVPWMLDLDNDGHVTRTAYLAALRERFCLPESVDQLSAEYRRCLPVFVAPPEADTVSALRRLREGGWRVGVVTNGAPSQEAKLARAGLVDLLDGWCVSDLVGHRKPDPEIFRVAARRCGAPLEGAWMVGDSGPDDIAGASALGMSSIWLRRGRAWPFAVIARPTWRIASPK
jgi:HAD superfamily hydrolase (TIGR01509 family)